jgi:hypothetical protein
MEDYVKDFHWRFPSVRIVAHNELARKVCQALMFKPILSK